MKEIIRILTVILLVTLSGCTHINICTQFQVTRDVIGTSWEASSGDRLFFSNNKSDGPEPKFNIEHHISLEKPEIIYYTINNADDFREIGNLIEIYPTVDSIRHGDITTKIGAKSTSTFFIECETNDSIMFNAEGGMSPNYKEHFVRTK